MVLIRGVHYIVNSLKFLTAFKLHNFELVFIISGSVWIGFFKRKNQWYNAQNGLVTNEILDLIEVNKGGCVIYYSKTGFRNVRCSIGSFPVLCE